VNLNWWANQDIALGYVREFKSCAVNISKKWIKKRKVMLRAVLNNAVIIVKIYNALFFVIPKIS